MVQQQAAAAAQQHQLQQMHNQEALLERDHELFVNLLFLSTFFLFLSNKKLLF